MVRSSRTGTWFQSPRAYDFFASLPLLFTPFVVAIRDDKPSLRGVCVGYVTREKKAFRQFFTRRAIILGGPCLADDATSEEVEALMNAVKDTLYHTPYTIHPIYIETRNFNDFSPWRLAFEKAGFAYKKHLNFHVTTEGFEERLSDNRKRQVRKAKELVICELATSEADITEWYKVLAKLYKTKVKTPLFPVEFFLEAYRQKMAKFLFVKQAGRVIGGSMVAKDDKCIYEWFECGLNTEFKDQYPSVMATYSGIQYAQQQGCSRYDMMGAGEPGVPYGVRNFKAEFGGQLVEHGRFLCVCKPGLYRLGALCVRILKWGA